MAAEDDLYLLRSSAAFDTDKVWTGDRFKHFELHSHHKKLLKKTPVSRPSPAFCP